MMKKVQRVILSGWKLETYHGASMPPHVEGGGKSGTLIVIRDNERGGINAQAIVDLIRKALVA